jgi:hypothetical protein
MTSNLWQCILSSFRPCHSIGTLLATNLQTKCTYYIGDWFGPFTGGVARTSTVALKPWAPLQDWCTIILAANKLKPTQSDLNHGYLAQSDHWMVKYPLHCTHTTEFAARKRSTYRSMPLIPSDPITWSFDMYRVSDYLVGSWRTTLIMLLALFLTVGYQSHHLRLLSMTGVSKISSHGKESLMSLLYSPVLTFGQEVGWSIAKKPSWIHELAFVVWTDLGEYFI